MIDNCQAKGGNDMSLSKKSKIVVFMLCVMPILLAAGCFLYPPEIRYNSYLAPNLETKDPAVSQDQDNPGTMIYDIGGSSVVVRYMQDAELNTLFPDESKNDKYSTNPYTYGDWVDPDVGYTPNRFTVFNVTLLNRVFPKMWLDPTEAVLITDTGEVLHSYTVNIASAKYGNSFENYYRAILGQSGNDYYRYEMRLGMVRGKNYGLEEYIFRGDSYSGLVAFDTLRPEIKRVRLLFKKVVYRFDAFNRPSDTVDVTFNLDRKIDRQVVTHEERMKELEREKVRIRFSGTQQLVGARTNDSARAPRSIDRTMEAGASQMEKCFLDRYRKGEVNPGRMTLSFTIEPSGLISSQNVTEVQGINSEPFMNCILDVVKTLKFEKIADMPMEGTNIVKGPARPVNVTYPLEFSVATEEEKK
jgi:hypothetical protein